MISEGLKKPISKEEILSNDIKLSYLKKIDQVFNKGLHFYLDPKAPEESKEASIFFRKQKFNSDLSIGAKKIVNHFEEFKISLSAISKLAEIKIERTIPIYSINSNAKIAAKEIRQVLYPIFNNDKKEFLKLLISKFAEKNILVFEFVETWNKKERANIDGFFLNPNVIVLKRQQISFRREIFTLIHELGHFLLNEEEIESLDYTSMAEMELSHVERWCNDFAFYFLIGDFEKIFSEIDRVGSDNDYYFDLIERISSNTHISKIALYTRLLLEKKISITNYSTIKKNFDEQFTKKKEEEKRLRKLELEKGIKIGGSTPKPIKSPLLISTIQAAFYGGVINEYEVCKRLNIKPENIDKFIQ